MAAGVEGEVVKAPGMLTLTAYCTCPDVTKVVTPDLKKPGNSSVIFVDLAPSGKRRLGGTALAQVFGQIGDCSPDVGDGSATPTPDDFAPLNRAFDTVQGLIDAGLLLAGHDRSDGGLVTTLLEMCFAGNCGLAVDLDRPLC